MYQRSDYQLHGPDRAMAARSKEQNRPLDQWNYVPPYNYFDGSLDPHHDWEDDRGDDWYDDGPTSCRDIINSWDYDCYYSD